MTRPWLRRGHGRVPLRRPSGCDGAAPALGAGWIEAVASNSPTMPDRVAGGLWEQPRRYVADVVSVLVRAGCDRSRWVSPSLSECAVVTVVTPALAVERQGVTADEIVLYVARLLTALVLLMANLGTSRGVGKSCVGCWHGYVARQGLSTCGAQAFLVACCSLGGLPDACAVRSACELLRKAGAF
jgi:hypothetical protein